jgi:thymidylate synthase (FAD)
MILIKPSFEIMTDTRSIPKLLYIIEDAGRTCYKSEKRGEPHRFILGIIERGHESVIEHANITVRIICDRGVTHEIVRHRLVSYSQESTRYCNYKGGVTFVIPPWLTYWIKEGSFEDSSWRPNNTLADLWFMTMLATENSYKRLLEEGWSPQQARSVLPNSLKTEIVMTANLREWRHIFRLRTAKAAHPQMREVMIPLLQKFKEFIPVVFEDIKEQL